MNRDVLRGMNGRYRPDLLLRKAFAWWVGELASCVPGGLRQRVAAMHGPAVLVVDPASGSRLADDRGRTLRRGGNGAADVSVRLPEHRSLRTVVSLPLAAERNFDQVVGFEFERLTPFKRDEVYYTARIAKRDHKTRRMRVELTVVPRATVDDAVRVATESGYRAVAIEVDGPDGATPIPCDLLRQMREPAGRRLLRIGLGTIALATVALAIAAAVIPMVQSASEVRVLTARVAAARREADETVRLGKAIATETENAQILVARKNKTVPVTEILDALTRLLPDDVWLTELQIGAKDVHMSGFATSATSLLGILDHSSRFANAAFRSPVTQNSIVKREQFDISAQIQESRR